MPDQKCHRVRQQLVTCPLPTCLCLCRPIEIAIASGKTFYPSILQVSQYVFVVSSRTFGHDHSRACQFVTHQVSNQRDSQSWSSIPKNKLPFNTLIVNFSVQFISKTIRTRLPTVLQGTVKVHFAIYTLLENTPWSLSIYNV